MIVERLPRRGQQQSGQVGQQGAGLGGDRASQRGSPLSPRRVRLRRYCALILLMAAAVQISTFVIDTTWQDALGGLSEIVFIGGISISFLLIGAAGAVLYVASRNGSRS